MKETTMTIAKNLRFYTDRMGVNQSRLAAEIGSSIMTVNRWMNGKVCPNIDQLERCAEALCIGIGDLIFPRDPAAADEQTAYHAYACLYDAVFGQDKYVMPDQYVEVSDYVMTECLSDREKNILTLRYGLDNGGIRTLDNIGKMYDLTRERVRQIQEKALERLRSCRDELQINTLFELKEKKQDPESELCTPQQMVMDGFGEDTPEQAMCADHDEKRSGESRTDSGDFDCSLYGFTWEDLGVIGTLDFQFSHRTSNCLKRNGVHSTFQVLQMSDRELMNFPGLGKKGVQEIQEVKKSLLRKMPFLKTSA